MEVSHFLDLKLHYRDKVIKIICIVIKECGTGIKIDTDQWKRIKTPKINSCKNGQLIYDKGAKNTQRGKGSLFNKWCWENWIITCRRMKLDPYLSPLTKINWKWIKDLNVRSESIKLLEENIEKKLFDMGLGNNFLYMTPKHMQQKPKSTSRRNSN